MCHRFVTCYWYNNVRIYITGGKFMRKLIILVTTIIVVGFIFFGLDRLIKSPKED